MKKYSILLVSSIWLLSSCVSVAHAQGDENVTKRRPDRPANPQIQEIRQEFRSNVTENHANRLEKRFSFYVKRFENILTRFQTRLNLLTSQGKDITSIQTKLEATKIKLAQAKAKGAEAVAAFRAIDPAKFSEMKTERLAARDLAMAARKLFVETHTLLKDALKALKTISQPALPAAEEAL